VFNVGTTYQARFGEVLAKDFVNKFPGMVKDDQIEVKFVNCPKAGTEGWADCIFADGMGVISSWQEQYPNYKGRVFGAYLAKLYGNCGVAVVSGLSIGVGKKGMCGWWLEWINKMLSEMGYTIAIGTTNPSQKDIHPRLIKAGWKQIEALNFTNRRTKNDIVFWRNDLPEFPPKEVPLMAHRGPIV